MLRALGLSLTLGLAAGSARAEVDYSRDVRPILSKHCFACHGPDEGKREADLRLDRAADAYADRGGYAVVVSGRPQDSELLRRVTADDGSLRMPPEGRAPLAPGEVETLAKWVSEGAEYREHWSFTPIARPTPPSVNNAKWLRNDIDRFVLAKMEQAGTRPAAEADRYRLVRRVYLDLIGLPPTPEEAARFVRDSRPDAYEHLVDELLASQHYGERWARRWLDLARYSDTNGYEKDRPRTMWLYRDWVINALNADMPFDQFTIEQLAGDMLPEATAGQQIATGFHRNTMLNEEGGVDPQEFRYLSIVDRVATTGAVWLGMTVGCAQCHTHKYDPITHADYFGLFALFNNADEVQLHVADEHTSDKQLQAQAELAAAQAGLAAAFPAADQHRAGGEDATLLREAAIQQGLRKWMHEVSPTLSRWRSLDPVGVQTNLPTSEILADDSILISGDYTKNDTYVVRYLPSAQPITALRLEVLTHGSLPGKGPGRQMLADDAESGAGDFFLSSLQVFVAEMVDGCESLSPVVISATSATTASKGQGVNGAVDDKTDTGWSVGIDRDDREVAVLQLAEPVRLSPGQSLVIRMEHESFYPAGLGRFRFSSTSDQSQPWATNVPDDVANAILVGDSTPGSIQADRLRQYFLSIAPQLKAERQRLAELRQAIPQSPTAMIMKERLFNPRVTYRRHRGEYTSPREEVTPRVPECLPPLPSGAPANRLTFARWLVSPENPLTSRVTVNRQWEAFFGRGLVATLEDFGVQGEYPTHPELLDWLAVEFIQRGWSLKQLHRLIVTSATYRQESTISAESLQRDPQNKLIARGPRHRVDAEIVRDIVLRASGLLSSRVGGPSVYPSQPDGAQDGAYAPHWRPSEGEDRFRRGLYTFNKRVAPYAAFVLFDAPTGEVCIPRRTRSNTPLQSLQMLNDEITLLAARAMVQDRLRSDTKSGPRSDEASIARDIFTRCLTRPADSEEIDAIIAFYRGQAESFAADLDSAKAIVGEPAESAASASQTETVAKAAWIATARCLLNVDELITKP